MGTKAKEIYSHSLEVRSHNQGTGRAALPPQALGDLLPLSWC